jgi:SAM-dependent methyltransferase
MREPVVGGMVTVTPGPAEVVDAYRRVALLYASVPPLCMWRAWELAAYRHFSLEEPALDLGCGDGRFFRLAWPDVRAVTGVEADIGVADAAVRSRVYADVRLASASDLPFADGAFASVFANCSLEHMDDLDRVLREVHRCLRPGGRLLASVVTDRWNRWATLPEFARRIAGPAAADALQRSFWRTHHAVTVVAPEEWLRRVAAAGFEPTGLAPIVPEVSARVFLLLDAAWHLPGEGDADSLGTEMMRFLDGSPGAADAGATILSGLLALERDDRTTAGLVLEARRA